MKNGQYVKHPARPEWGIGKVFDVSGNKASVQFEHAGVKTFDLTIVNLDAVEDAAPVSLGIDVDNLEALCKRFHADQEHNRRGRDDGKMALLILADVKRRGLPTESHKRRLLAWCHTEGHAFQSGVALAREICIAIYGLLLPDPDKIEKN